MTQQHRNYLNGNLRQGEAMPKVHSAILLSADGQVLSPGKSTLVSISSDNVTATNRTFTILDGSFKGQELHLNFISGSSYTCDLQSAGNVSLIAAWQPLQYQVLSLMWDGTLWVECSRSSTDTVEAGSITASEISDTDGAMKMAMVPVLFSDLVTAGDGVPFVSGPVIPDNAIIYQVIYDVIATFGGDGDDSSLISMGLEDQDNDVLAAAAIKTGTPFDSGIKAAIQVGTAGTAIKLTAARQLAVTADYATTDTLLDEGSMNVFIFYMVST